MTTISVASIVQTLLGMKPLAGDSSSFIVNGESLCVEANVTAEEAARLFPDHQFNRSPTY